MIEVTDEMLVAAMRAFEPMSSVLRYREKDKWHSCDMMAMRDAIRADLESQPRRDTYTEICMKEKCPRGGRPVEIMRAPVGKSGSQT